MKIKFSFLVALAAALVAGCAAYYSVFGLSQLFAGASIAVIIMASALEFSKIVAVSFLHRHWNRISKGLKTYLTVGVVVLVCITSAGIYGFLSNAYQKTAHKLEISEGQLAVINGKKEIFDKGLKDNETTITTKRNRLTQLADLRTNQESRLDAATTNSDKNRIRADINSATKEIQILNGEIDTLNKRNVSLTDSSNFYANKAIESKSNNNVAGEVGPLKYLAQLTGAPMDKIVNYFILLLIFVFDPLAVALVIATNRMLEIEKEDNEKEKQRELENSLPSYSGVDDYLEEKVLEPVEPIVNSEPEILEPTEIESELETEIQDVPDAPIEPEPSNEPEIVPEVVFKPKKEPVIPTGKVELQDIKEIKEGANRGFSRNIPTPNNIIQRIGTNKHVKNNETEKIIYKRK